MMRAKVLLLCLCASVATAALAQDGSSLAFQSGRSELDAGETDCIEVNEDITKPVIFLGPLSRSTIATAPAAVPRAEYKNETREFCLTLAPAPCDTESVSETVDYFIVQEAGVTTSSNGVKFAIFKQEVTIWDDKMKKVKKWPTINLPANSGLKDENTVCLNTIQTSNQTGYLQVNSDFKKAEARVRIIGTVLGNYIALNETSTEESTKYISPPEGSTETVGFLCLEVPDAPVTLTSGALDIEVRYSTSGSGWGLLNVPPRKDHNAMVLSGEISGKNPYHPRTIGANNGFHTFLIEEDSCEWDKVQHKAENFVSASFFVSDD